MITFKKYGKNVLINTGEYDVSVPVSCFVRPDPRNEDYIIVSDIASIQDEKKGIRLDVRKISGLAETERDNIIKELNYYYFVELDFNLEVGLGLNTGIESLYKFGRNPAVTQNEDIIWDGENGYTFLTSATNIQVSSDDTNDTSAGTGAREIHIFGLDNDFNEIDEIIPLNGVTPVTLTKQYRYIFRAKISKAGNHETNIGNITIETTTNTIQANILPENGQTLMCIYIVPAGKKLLLERVNLWTGKAKQVQARLKIRNLAISDGAWQTKATADAFESDIPEEFHTPRLIPEKHAVIITGQNLDNTTIQASATFEGKLIKMDLIS